MVKFLFVFCMVVLCANKSYALVEIIDYRYCPIEECGLDDIVDGYNCKLLMISSTRYYYCYGIPPAAQSTYEYQSDSILWNDVKYYSKPAYISKLCHSGDGYDYMEVMLYDNEKFLTGHANNKIILGSSLNPDNIFCTDYTPEQSNQFLTFLGYEPSESNSLQQIITIPDFNPGDSTLKFQSITGIPESPDPDGNGSGTDGNGSTDGSGTDTDTGGTDGNGTDEGGDTDSGSGGSSGSTGSGSNGGDSSSGGGGDSGSGLGDGSSEGDTYPPGGSGAGAGTGGTDTGGEGTTDGTTDGNNTSGGSIGTGTGDGEGTGEGDGDGEGDGVGEGWSFTEELPDFDSDFLQPEEKEFDQGFIESIPFVNSLKSSGIHLSDASGYLETQIDLGTVSVPFSLDFRPYHDFFNNLGVFIYAFACLLALRFAMRSY